ncbi:MAG: flagellin lysine-N-methylase, partial [Acutalibacteraceae bacterium]
MKSTCHEFYNKFKCIADKCPDSCCKEWDVVVDDDSYTKYKNAGGEIGERLRRVMTVDSDGDRIFTLCNNRCPFWNEDMLCDIYIEL